MANENTIGQVKVLNSGRNEAVISETNIKNAGCTAYIFVDGKEYKVPVDEKGKWSFTPPGGWGEGRHVVSIEIVDRAGNIGNPTFEIVNIDTSGPVKPEIFRVVAGNDYLTPGEATGDHKPVISGVAEPHGIVRLYGSDGVTVIGSTRADAMGAWTITPELADGEHKLTVKVEDGLKRVSDSSDTFIVNVNNGAVTQAVKEASDEAAQTVEPLAGDVGIHDNIKPIGIYKDNFTLSGTAEPGTVVQVLINNAIYTITVGADGKWSHRATDLDDGTYITQFRYKDRAGNWGPVTQRVIEIMPTEPEAPQIMRVLDDVGQNDYLAPMSYTNDKTPTLSGVAMPGSTVYIYENGVKIASVVAGQDGRWTTTIELNENLTTHNLTANYVDPFGKTSKTSDIFNLMLDLSTPTQPELSEVYDDVGRYQGVLKSGDTTDDTSPTLTGKADAGTLVRIWNGNELLGSVIANGRGEWKIDLQLEDKKSYTLRIDSVSKGGNVSAPTPDFELSVDASILPPADIDAVYNNNDGKMDPITNGGQTNDDTPLLTGTGNDGDIIYVEVDGKQVASTKVENGKWQIEVPKLAEGAHDLTVVVEDPSGKVSEPSAPFKVIVDVTPPDQPSKPGTIIDNEGPVTGPIEEGKPTDDQRPVFEGSDGEKGDQVELIIVDKDGNPIKTIGTGTVGDDGKWTVQPDQDLGNGEHNVVVVITDPAGNKSNPSDPVKVIVDDSKPAPLENFELFDDVGPYTGPIKNGDVTDDKNPTLQGSAPAGSKVNVYLDGKLVDTVDVGADGKWSYEFKDLNEANHNVYIRPVSPAGVIGDASAPVSFTVDVTPPTTGTFDGVYDDNKGLEQLVPIIDGEYLTNDPDLILKGTGQAGDIVLVYSDVAHQNLLGSTVIGADGKWRFETSEMVVEGEDKTFDFNVVIRDTAGNELNLPTNYQVRVDLEKPEAPDVGIESFGVFETLMDLSLNDIMALNSDSLFIDNGKSQVIVSGNAGDDVKLEDILPKGEDISNWNQANGTVTVAGVEYNVYQNTAGDAEVLVQNNLHNEQH